jgi:hypothetical protein
MLVAAKQGELDGIPYKYQYDERKFVEITRAVGKMIVDEQRGQLCEIMANHIKKQLNLQPGNEGRLYHANFAMFESIHMLVT